MDKLLKRKEIAKLLGVTYQSVKNWEKSGKIKPCFHVNGRPRFAATDIEKVYNNRFTVKEVEGEKGIELK